MADYTTRRSAAAIEFPRPRGGAIAQDTSTPPDAACAERASGRRRACGRLRSPRATTAQAGAVTKPVGRTRSGSGASWDPKPRPHIPHIRRDFAPPAPHPPDLRLHASWSSSRAYASAPAGGARSCRSRRSPSPTPSPAARSARRRPRRSPAVCDPRSPSRLSGFPTAAETRTPSDFMIRSRGRRPRQAGTLPRTDSAIEAALAIVRDLALFLADECGKRDWALTDVHDLASKSNARRRLSLRKDAVLVQRSKRRRARSSHPAISSSARTAR